MKNKILVGIKLFLLMVLLTSCQVVNPMPGPSTPTSVTIVPDPYTPSMPIIETAGSPYPVPGLTVTPMPNGIIEAVYNDPFTFSKLVDQCALDFRNDPPFYVPYIDEPGGFYVIPFYNNKGLCFTAYYSYQNGAWKWNAINDYIAGKSGDKYPQASAEDAKLYIEKMTCTKVIGSPQYVAQLHKYPLGPFWRMITEDGETYDVIGVFGQVESDLPLELHLNGWNAKDDFRMGLKSNLCATPEITP